jgi:ASC-1-like (ASCH) protein
LSKGWVTLNERRSRGLSHGGSHTSISTKNGITPKELTKAYNPKKPITLMLATKNKNTVKKGDKLIIEFDDLNSYIQDVDVQSCQWHIKFLNQSGKTIGILEQDKSTIQKILKAHFNTYLFDVEVSDTFSHLDYSEEKQRSNWKGYPIKLIITPYKEGTT